MPFCVWKCIPDVSLERYVLHVHLLLHHLVLSWSLEPVFWVVCLIVGCPLPSSAFSAPHQVSQALSSGPPGWWAAHPPHTQGSGNHPRGAALCLQADVRDLPWVQHLPKMDVWEKFLFALPCSSAWEAASSPAPRLWPCFMVCFIHQIQDHVQQQDSVRASLVLTLPHVLFCSIPFYFKSVPLNY